MNQSPRPLIANWSHLKSSLSSAHSFFCRIIAKEKDNTTQLPSFSELNSLLSFQGLECCVHLEELSVENNCISKFEGKVTLLFGKYHQSLGLHIAWTCRTGKRPVRARVRYKYVSWPPIRVFVMYKYVYWPIWSELVLSLQSELMLGTNTFSWPIKAHIRCNGIPYVCRQSVMYKYVYWPIRGFMNKKWPIRVHVSHSYP